MFAWKIENDVLLPKFFDDPLISDELLKKFDDENVFIVKNVKYKFTTWGLQLTYLQNM